LSLIIKAIEIKYGFNFTGGFFESMNYKDAYMSLNNSTTKLNSGFLEFENESGENPPESALSDDRLNYRVTITPKAGFDNVPYTLILTWNDQFIYESQTPLTGTQTKNATVSTPTENYNVTASIVTQEDFEFDATTLLRYLADVGGADDFINITLESNTYTDQVIDLVAVVNNLMYDIKTYDFLTSIFKMFNLVVFSEGTDLVVEDLQSWYAKGRIYDINKYVDTSKLKIAKGKIYNQLNFKFEDSEQIIANAYNENNRRYYGNAEIKFFANPEETILIDGDTLDVEVIFENPVFERLIDISDGSLTTIQYCPYFDKEIKPLTGNPFIFYADSVDISTNPIGFLGVNLISYKELDGNIIMPSHSRVISDETTFALNFENELSEYTYGNMGNNIYSKYYSDYISDIFSIKRRNYELTAILPDFLLNSLRLNDRLIIGDRRYIINKLTSDLVNRKDSFELINDIYDAPIASDLLSGEIFKTSGRFFNNESITDTVDYIGESISTPALRDLGDGTGWVTINSTTGTGVRTVNFTVDANASGLDRVVEITINNLKSIARFKIIQFA
jgi:hypothetical protein